MKRCRWRTLEMRVIENGVAYDFSFKKSGASSVLVSAAENKNLSAVNEPK